MPGYGFGYGYGAGVMRRRPSGGTPTPTPTPTVATIIYDADAEQFVVTNTAAFPGATWAWEDETETAISGQTATTLDRADAPEGLTVRAIANDDPDTASNWCIAPIDLPSKIVTFDQANGTSIDGVDGWSARNAIWNSTDQASPSTAMQVTDGYIWQVSASGGRWQRTDIPTGNKRVAIRNFRYASGSDSTAKYYRNLTINITGSGSSGTRINMQAQASGTGYIISKSVAGVATTLVNSAGAGTGWSAPSEFAVEIIGGRLRAYADGVELAKSVADGGWDVSDVPSTGKFSFDAVGEAPSPPPSRYPYRYCDEFEFTALPDIFFALTSATYDAGTLSVAGTCTASVTNYDYALVDAQGRVLVDLTSNAPVDSAGVFSFSATPPVDAMGKHLYVAIRPSSDKTNLLILDAGQMPFVDPVRPFVLGMNEGPIASYGETDWLRDRGYVVGWRYRDSVSDRETHRIPADELSEYGYPIVAPADTAMLTDGDGVNGTPTTFDSLRCALFEGGDRHIGTRQGTWLVNTNSPSTLTEFFNSNTTITDVTSTGCKVETVTPGVGTVTAISFKDPTVPSEGFQLSMRIEGDDSTALFTDAAAAKWHASNFGGELWIRDMKSGGAAAAGAGQVYKKYSTSPEAAAARYVELGAHTFHTFTWGDAAFRFNEIVKPWIDSFKLLANPAAKAGFEVGNEVWSDAPLDAPQLEGMMAEACQRRMISGVSIPVGKVVTNERASVVPGTGETLREFQPGEWFYCRADNWQHLLIEVVAASPVAAGATINATTNANFAVRAVYSALKFGARRLQASLQKQVGLYAKSQLGDRAQSILGAFLLDGVTDANELVDSMLFDDNWQGIDWFSPSFYAGQRRAYSYFPWYASHTSDFAAFKTGFISNLESTWANTLAKLLQFKQQVPEALIQNGVPAAQCPRLGFLYEGGDHNTIGDPPEEEVAGLIAAVQSCLRSDEYAAKVEDMLSDLETYIGGVCVWFMDVERVSLNGSQIQWFGAREYFLDGAWNTSGANEKRYAAMLAHFAGGA